MRPASAPYRGPIVVLTLAEAARVLDWAHADPWPDATTLAVREKTAAALDADPRFRTPTT